MTDKWIFDFDFVRGLKESQLWNWISTGAYLTINSSEREDGGRGVEGARAGGRKRFRSSRPEFMMIIYEFGP